MQVSLIGELIRQPYLTCILLFALLLASVEIGRIFARKRRGGVDSEAPGTGAINGAVFALLGLILAFTFSGANTRFEGRRDLIVAESNAIGTAYLRVDLVAPDAQPALRAAFRRYVDSRIFAYSQVADVDKFRAALVKSGAIQKEIWGLAIAAGRRPDALPAVNISLLPALNEMIDIAAVSGFLAGIGLAAGPRQSWVHPVSFALIMTAAIYITIDLEFPRGGFIRVDSFEKAVVDFSRES
jgi:hypothetical protein